MAQASVVQDKMRKKVHRRPQRHKTGILRTWNKNKALWLLFLPCLLYYLIFRYAPMFGLVITFKDYNLLKEFGPAIGWDSNITGCLLRIPIFGR